MHPHDKAALYFFAGIVATFGLVWACLLVQKQFKIHCYREAAAMGIEESRHVRELCD